MGPTFTRISFAQDDSKGTRRLVGLPSYFLMSSLKLYSKPSGFQEQKNKKFLLKRSSKNNEKKKRNKWNNRSQREGVRGTKRPPTINRTEKEQMKSKEEEGNRPTNQQQKKNKRRAEMNQPNPNGRPCRSAVGLGMKEKWINQRQRNKKQHARRCLVQYLKSISCPRDSMFHGDFFIDAVGLRRIALDVLRWATESLGSRIDEVP